jgi:indolepyruvate ferredoxin oxidoreductase
MIKGFEILAKMKGLRGTVFDIFGYSAERKMERQLIEDYRQTIGDLLDSLNSDNYAIAVQLASLPAEIRGFGHVKDEALAKSVAEKRGLLEAFARAGTTIASDGAVRYQEALR